MLIVVIVFLCFIILIFLKKIYISNQHTSSEQLSIEEKISASLVSSIWIQIDRLNTSIPLHSSVLGDTIFFASFYHIISNVLTDYNLQEHFQGAYVESLKRFTGGSKKQQEAALAAFTKCRKDFSQIEITSLEDLGSFCFSTFILAHDYYDYDEYFDRAEKIYMDAICDFIDASTALIESALGKSRPNFL